MAELLILRIDGERAVAVEHGSGSLPLPDARAAHALACLVHSHPDADVAWLDHRRASELVPAATWPAFRRHPLELLHLGDVDPETPAVAALGWVDFEAPHLLPAPADQRRATALVSARAGLVRGALLGALGFAPGLGLTTALVDVGMRGMAEGLFPMAEPRFFAPGAHRPQPTDRLDATTAAKLIRRFLGRRWVGVWLLAHLLFRRRLPVLAALRGCATRPASPTDHDALARFLPTAPPRAEHAKVEAIIPTLGRPRLVADLLEDLAAQTEPPRRVVIVDQQPDDTAPDGPADGDQRVSVEPAGARPFAVERRTVTWAGACRARDLGIARTEADWVLLLDDDVRLRPDAIEHLLDTARAYRADAVNPRVYLPDQAASIDETDRLPHLWSRFAGVALLSRTAIETAGGFDRRLEGGYGEDFEYGMRLRRGGLFVVRDPRVPVLHLHAPHGGLRAPRRHPWPADGPDAPKPSPTFLLSRHLHQTRAMRQGYLLFFVLAHLRATPPWRWARSLPRLARRWRASRRWTDALAERDKLGTV